MNEFQRVFERLLFEFDWGQARPENQVEKVQPFPIDAKLIEKQGDIERYIAVYHNWYNCVHETEKETKQDILDTQTCMQYRITILAELQNRFIKDQPDHPLLVIYGFDCQQMKKTAQDCICLVSPDPDS